MNQCVRKVYQCRRNINKFGVGHHTDTIFCSRYSCLLVSFHENVSRVDIGKFSLKQAKDIYYTCEEFEVDDYIKFNYVDFKARQIAGNKGYDILKNNCNHSAKELLDMLGITKHKTISPKNIK